MNKTTLLKTMLLLVGYLYLFTTANELKDVDLANFGPDQGFTMQTNAASELAPAGDINKDGLPDIMIKSIVGCVPSSGCAYILFGRQEGGFPSDIDFTAWDSTLGIKIEGANSAEGTQLGYALGFAGDLNNDEIDDVFISAPVSSGGGAAYIIFGKDGLNADVDIATLTLPDGIKILGAASTDRLGYTWSRLGDVNGDSIDDIAISAADAANGKRGVVYIIFGGAGFTSDIDLSSTSLSGTGKGIQITGANNNDLLGYTVSSAGDANGDGINDILVASPTAGVVYLIFGGSGMTDISVASLGSKGIEITNNTPSLQAGSTLSSGDFNGDGKSDLAIAASGADGGNGAIYVIFGRDASAWSNLNLDTLTAADGAIKISTATDRPLIGAYMKLYDLNNDGIDDLITSSSFAAAAGRTACGIVFVILGKKSGLADMSLGDFTSSDGMTIIGANGSDFIGYGLAIAGDLDGDGVGDLLIKKRISGSYLLYTSSFLTQSPASGNGDDDDMIQRIVDYQITAGIIIAVTTSSIQMNQAGSTAVITAVLLARQIMYIRYLDIAYPDRPKHTFQKLPYNIITVNFGPLFPGSLRDEAARFPGPARFARYINGLLVTNFWRALTTFGILLIVLGIALILRRIQFKNEKVRLVKEKLLSFIFANYMFSFFLTNADNIILFSSVNYESLDLEGSLAIASFVISILCLLALFAVLIFIPYHLHRLRKSKKYQCKEDKVKAHDSSKVLFAEVKDKYFIQELYVFVLCFRVALHNIIVGALDSPILQCSLLIVLNILMIAYMVSLRPHQKTITNIEVVGYEIFILIANLACISIANQDYADQPNAIALGDLIIACNIMIITFAMILNITKAVLVAIPIIKQKLAARKKKPELAKQIPANVPESPDTHLVSPLSSPKNEAMEKDSLLTISDVGEEDLASSKMKKRMTSQIKPMNTMNTAEREETDQDLIEIKRIDTDFDKDV